MNTLFEENYLRPIFSFRQITGTEGSGHQCHCRAKSNQSPSSVTDMIKKIVRKDLVNTNDTKGFVNTPFRDKKGHWSIIRN